MNFGGSPVVGLPFVGNAVQVSTVASANKVAITDETVFSPAPNNFAIGGRDIEVGKFKLAAPNDEKVTVNSIKIANSGAGISTGEIDNIDLYNGTTKIGSGEVDRDIVFDAPIEIPASGSVILTVKINSTVDIDNGDTFRAQIADAKDIDATGDLFGASLDLDILVPLNLANTYTAAGATVTVTGIQAAQSTTALQTAKNFKLGTIFVKNNNVEDIRLSTLKVNIVPDAALASLDSIKNLRLIAPDGTTVLDSVTNLDSRPTAAQEVIADNVVTADNDYVVTFSLANEYTVAKNTEVGFSVLADIPTVLADAGRKVRLTFYQGGTTTALSHLLAVGQSSGVQLTANNPAATPVLANQVTITASGSQTIILTPDSDFDTAAGDLIPAGSSRVVASWKIADNALNEDANVTEILLTNDVVTDPASYHLSNFELYHDGVKVATAPTMSSDGKVTFGDGETTMFTVTDGDTSGKMLVVKADISSDVTKNSQLNLKIAAVVDLEAKGSSTGALINASAIVGFANDKLLKQTYATITKEEGVATSVSASTSTELLRFTVTPEAGEVLNLSDLGIRLYDALGTTVAETINIVDVTDTSSVTLSAPVTFAGGADVTVTFNDADYTTQDKPVTFSVRANTLSAGGTFQIGIRTTGNMLRVTAATQDGTATGFAPLGDKIVGPTVTATK
jgi:hypothetical protein